MRILLLNQAYVPDVVSTAQHAADLVQALAAAGHDVTVIASSRAYDNPSKRFPRRSTLHGATVLRIPTTGLGKSRAWRRTVDFASFLFNCALLLFVQPRYDVVIAMTSPPLIGVLAALFTRLRGGKLISWIMDLNPDEAIAAGWLRPTSLIARLLESALRFNLRTSSQIVVLDTFMRDRIAARGIPASKLAIIPPWTHDSAVSYDPDGRARFRIRHNLSGQFVVMYSGNLSPCHPLDTLLDSAAALAGSTNISFCFIGGGSGMDKVRSFAAERRLANVICLPYQPLDELSASLSTADLHVVVMGNPFVGIVHPCKIYNILALGTPFLYIGPETSHITALTPTGIVGRQAWFARHGEVESVTEHILNAYTANEGSTPLTRHLAHQYSASALLPQWISLIENVPAENAPTSNSSTAGTVPASHDALQPAPIARVSRPGPG